MSVFSIISLERVVNSMSNSISFQDNSTSQPIKSLTSPCSEDDSSAPPLTSLQQEGSSQQIIGSELTDISLNSPSSLSKLPDSSAFHPHPAIANINKRLDSLTPKGRILGDYIVQNPGKVVLMTTRQLAQTCGISEATVVRFAMGVGYSGYGELQQALKDFVSTGLTLPDRSETNEIMEESGLNRLHRVIFEELSELRFFYETININTMNEFINSIIASPVVYFIGSRISYTSAYYMGWSLTKIRKGIHTLKGSDSTSIDTLSAAPEGSLVVLIATTRYPNELIKLSKLIQRLGHRLLVLTDSPTSPVVQFADLSLIVPMQAVPFIGNPSNMLCVIKYIVQEIAAGQGEDLKEHQQNVEQIYLENDILFNLK